ncbi:FKBP-type peptidyl-prolyl cis-trans isomerase SlyD, partial [Haemophilus influenzae]
NRQNALKILDPNELLVRL